MVLEDAVSDLTDTDEARDGRTRSSESIVSQVEAPPSASQVYHAALADSSTLDDVLAGVEADKGSQGLVVDRIVIRRKPRAYLPEEQLDTMDHQKHLRYRNPSVHSIEGGGDDSTQPHGKTPGSDAQLPQEPRTLEPEDPAAEAAETPGKTQVDCDHDLQRLENSLDSDLACEHGMLEVQSPERHLSLHALNPCPTFVRRHTRSLLPRRSVSGDKQPFAVLKHRGAMSSPELPSSTPTKARARLQRRVGPKQSQAKLG